MTTEVVYVSSSRFKKEENVAFSRVARLPDGSQVKDEFTFRLVPLRIIETLEVDLDTMVREEVLQAYGQVKVPCLVEHAGLILKKYQDAGFPGGLTKPMWDTLQQDFLVETNWGGEEAIARAVVAYCDGTSVQTFVGETEGRLADSPRGGREFYWDTIFVPDTVGGSSNELTYAELVDRHGLDVKMAGLSQSAKAMMRFLTYRKSSPPPLWR